MKVCRKCGKEKPLTSFQFTSKRVVARKTARRVASDSRLSTDGRKSTCKACYKKVGRQRRGATPRSVIAERTARERARRAATVAQRKAAGDRIARLVAQLLREDPRAALLSYTSRVYRARYRYDPAFRAKEIMRRQRMDYSNISDDGTLTPDVVRRLFAEATHCPYCTRALASREKVLDHVYPRVRGGAHSIRNVVVCCRSCNAQKHDLLPAQWAARCAARSSRVNGGPHNDFGSSPAFLTEGAARLAEAAATEFSDGHVYVAA